MNMERLIDSPFSEGLDTIVKLVRDRRFTRKLAAEIRKPKGVKRALDALWREFFPAKQEEVASIASSPEPWPILPLPPFDPAKFIGEGWSYRRGPLGGNGLSKTDEPDEDSREKELTEFNTAQLQGAFMVKKGDPSISGEEYLDRLKNDTHCRLGPREFLALWNEPGKKTLERYRKEQNIEHWYFFVPLRGHDGERYVLCLRWDGQQWVWRYYRLSDRWGAVSRAAVLAP